MDGFFAWNGRTSCMKVDSDSDTDCFVYAPVLNSLQYNNEKGVEATVILKFAVEFFEGSRFKVLLI